MDAGCGEGAYLPYFRSRVVAVDMHLLSLLEARAYCGDADYVYADLLYLPFRPRVFRFILNASVVEHIAEHDLDRFFASLKSVLHGILLIETANMSLLQETLRALVYKHRIHVGGLICLASSSPLEHRSHWTVTKLRRSGFNVYGCLGWVTAKYLKQKWLSGLYDRLSWRAPVLAGTILGVTQV